jgi:hypothetical protein
MHLSPLYPLAAPIRPIPLQSAMNGAGIEHRAKLYGDDAYSV